MHSAAIGPAEGPTPYTSSPTMPFHILVSASLAPYLPSLTIFSW